MLIYVSGMVAQHGFPWGGMEHWGLITYAPQSILVEGGNDDLLAHEIAHQVEIALTLFRAGMGKFAHAPRNFQKSRK